MVWASGQDASWAPSLEVFWARPTSRRPGTRWRDYISYLAWEYLGIPPEELENIAGERDVWNTLLSLLPPQPGPEEKRKRMDEWMDGWMGGCIASVSFQPC